MTQYSDDTLSAVKSFGLLEYPIPQILLLISDLTTDAIDDYTFTQDINDVDHPLHKAYMRGKAMAEYQIDKKLFEMAKGGDMDALDKFERRKRMRNQDD